MPASAAGKRAAKFMMSESSRPEATRPATLNAIATA
jgi:hypothetical protein